MCVCVAMCTAENDKLSKGFYFLSKLIKLIFSQIVAPCTGGKLSCFNPCCCFVSSVRNLLAFTLKLGKLALNMQSAEISASAVRWFHQNYQERSVVGPEKP